MDFGKVDTIEMAEKGFQQLSYIPAIGLLSALEKLTRQIPKSYELEREGGRIRGFLQLSDISGNTTHF